VKTAGVVVLLLLLTAACAVPADHVRYTAAAAGTETGEIIVIRPRGGCPGAAVPVPVTVDDHHVHNLACQEHIVLTVPAGERVVALRWVTKRQITVSVDAGSRHYLRLDASPSGPVLNRTTAEVAERLMRYTRPGE
jgi:hypothetical protein